MKIANIGFLLTIEVLQALSHPSDWKKVQAGSSASVKHYIPTKTNRAVCSFTQEKILWVTLQFIWGQQCAIFN